MQVKSTARKVLLVPVMNVTIWNSAISKSTDPIVAGAAQTHTQKRQGSPESAFSAFRGFLKNLCSMPSVFLWCALAPSGMDQQCCGKAVKLSCVMLPSRYALCMVIAATVNLCTLLMFATWFILLQLCKSWARANFF